jgi:hypothetical protein
MSVCSFPLPFLRACLAVVLVLTVHGLHAAEAATVVLSNLERIYTAAPATLAITPAPLTAPADDATGRYRRFLLPYGSRLDSYPSGQLPLVFRTVSVEGIFRQPPADDTEIALGYLLLKSLPNAFDLATLSHFFRLVPAAAAE